MQGTWEDREYFCLSEEEFIIFILKDGEEKSRTHAQRKITLLFLIVLAH